MIETGLVGPKKTVVLATADRTLRRRLHDGLTGLRWTVREAKGGAEALAQLEEQPTEALLLDAWLPDLDVAELIGQIHALHPQLDLLRMDGEPVAASPRSPYRHELMHALHQAQKMAQHRTDVSDKPSEGPSEATNATKEPEPIASFPDMQSAKIPRSARPSLMGAAFPMPIEELVGASPEMLDLGRLIRLVAPRSTTVLIEGETGTGKELVAHAVHRLSTRSTKPLVVLNCAAIPEALLEAELFGHTRGSFTGAIQSRTGRIEAANGGTLFLDEIGEMAVPLQAKMLRFLSSGELQRVGENDPIRVDVRVIAATHQHLESRAAEGSFRLDLYHRLAVFPIEVPPLRSRPTDIPLLVEHFLSVLGRTTPRKTLSPGAMQLLRAHSWPGNVRELGHVLERATILAEDSPIIHAEHIRLRRKVRLDAVR
jgi:DNA-binding NtrC family response regulator